MIIRGGESLAIDLELEEQVFM